VPLLLLLGLALATASGPRPVWAHTDHAPPAHVERSAGAEALWRAPVHPPGSAASRRLWRDGATPQVAPSGPSPQLARPAALHPLPPPVTARHPWPVGEPRQPAPPGAPRHLSTSVTTRQPADVGPHPLSPPLTPHGAWPPRATHHGPPPVAAVVAGAAVALAAALRGRRPLAVVLALLLGVAAFEGAGHAAMHLGHVPHGDGMAIGASPGQPCAVAGSEGPADGTPLWSPEAAPESPACPSSQAAAAPYEGRAPPLA
jgi:hypothetical protein